MADKMFQSPALQIGLPIAAGIAAAASPAVARGSNALLSGMANVQRNKRIQEIVAMENEKRQYEKTTKWPQEQKQAEATLAHTQASTDKIKNPPPQFVSSGGIPSAFHSGGPQGVRLDALKTPEQVAAEQRPALQQGADINVDQFGRQQDIALKRQKDFATFSNQLGITPSQALSHHNEILGRRNAEIARDIGVLKEKFGETGVNQEMIEDITRKYDNVYANSLNTMATIAGVKPLELMEQPPQGYAPYAKKINGQRVWTPQGADPMTLPKNVQIWYPSKPGR